ncbi:MAG: class I SAM-dependent methyltransferase [Proteobacteria bacterium]|nr:class I SAM-dependent methyltransferase [Pseudomonadota bacterium]
MDPFPLYESPGVRDVTGPTIRPGGFDLTMRAVDFCGLPEGAAVLDIGCGLGATVNFLRTGHGLKAVGLDASAPLLREGRSAHPAGVLVAGRADRLPFPDASFEAVFCECVLSILDDPGAALAGFQRVLRPGGWLVLTDLCARRPEGAPALSRLPLNSCLRGAGPRTGIVARVESAGFETALWEDHSDLLKHLAARLVFEYGSLRRFWSRFAPRAAETEIECALARARPGYYLMAARKRN